MHIMSSFRLGASNLSSAYHPFKANLTHVYSDNIAMTYHLFGLSLTQYFGAIQKNNVIDANTLSLRNNFPESTNKGNPFLDIQLASISLLRRNTCQLPKKKNTFLQMQGWRTSESNVRFIKVKIICAIVVPTPPLLFFFFNASIAVDVLVHLHKTYIAFC